MTVIFGVNGAGKTTIIECLRVMASGQMPPNTNNGKTFIVDLNMSRVAEIKSYIKMKFR